MKATLIGLFLLLLFVSAACTSTSAQPTPQATVAPTRAAARPRAATPSAPTRATRPTNAPAPTRALGELKTYRDEFAGFELDYPAAWNMTPIADEAKQNAVIYAVTFYSWQPGAGGGEGVPSGGTKMDVVVESSGAQSPHDALAKRKQQFADAGLAQKVLDEQTWTLPNGIQATRMHVSGTMGESVEVVTALHGKTLILGGVGDFELVDAIARTLRPLPASTADATAKRYYNAEGKFSLQLPDEWTAAGPMKMENDPQRPFNQYVLGTNPGDDGGPDASRIVIADAQQWTPEQFAQSQCSVCPAHPFEKITLGGKPAQKTQVGGGSVSFLMTWYFVEHNDKLIAFAIHDRETLAPLENVITSIQFQ
ncbi:MAG: hypothetical protein HY741_06890 [Chloroflexi bacterium]|nr:hypothetical protein [Chloroflexota bacterium]